MKHKHCFAIKVDCKENEGRNSVDSHCMTGKLNGSCNNVDPHMSDEVVGHMVVAGFVCIFCVVGAHEIKKNAESSFGKKSNKVVKFAPEHDERRGGTYHGSHDGKGETAGFTVKKIKSCGDEKEAEEIEKISDFVPDKIKRSEHKAHTDNDGNCAFKFKLVFFHFLIIPLKKSGKTCRLIFVFFLTYIFITLKKRKSKLFLK